MPIPGHHGMTEFDLERYTAMDRRAAAARGEAWRVNTHGAVIGTDLGANIQMRTLKAEVEKDSM